MKVKQPKTKRKKTIRVLVRGICRPCPGFGTWTFVVMEKNKTVSSGIGFDPNTTQGRMDYRSMIEAFKAIEDLELVDKKIVVETKSFLLANVLSGWLEKWESREWKRVRNKDLLLEINSLKERFNFTVDFDDPRPLLT